MTTYHDVQSKLVLTHHGEDNYRWRRNNIPLRDVIRCIADGELGFAGGNNRYKSTHYKLGVEVIWKKSKDGKYVVITYYKINPKHYTNIVDRLLGDYDGNNRKKILTT